MPLKEFMKENHFSLEAVNQANKENKLPLITAIKEEKIDIVTELLKAGADANKQDFSGLTALTLAVELKNKTIIGLLITYGADPFLANGHGNSPLKLSYHYKLKDVSAMFENTFSSSHTKLIENNNSLEKSILSLKEKLINADKKIDRLEYDNKALREALGIERQGYQALEEQISQGQLDERLSSAREEANRYKDSLKSAEEAFQCIRECSTYKGILFSEIKRRCPVRATRAISRINRPSL